MTTRHDAPYPEDVPIKLFVFEDHWMCREALMAVLGRSRSLEIVGEADNVDEGLQRAVAAEPHVVLLVVQLGKDDDLGLR